MDGRNIRARSSRDLSVRWCNAHRRIVCRITFSAFGLASRWQEGSAISTAMPDRLSRTKGVAEKVKRLDRKVATPVRILTIDELRLRRMKNQPTGPEADLQGMPEPASFFFASAVADNVVRVSLERDGGETPRHPPVKSIVQEQIGQDGADHPTLRRPCRTRDDATVLHFDGSF